MSFVSGLQCHRTDVDTPCQTHARRVTGTGTLGLVNAMLGAAVLAYPYAFMSAGALIGTLICLCVIAPLSTTGLTVLLSSMRYKN